MPIYGLPGTLHKKVYRARDHAFVPEFFADLDYDDDGNLVIGREHPALDPDIAVQRTIDALSHQRIVAVGGRQYPVRIETICVHSDTPNALAIATAVAATLTKLAAD